MQFELNGKLLTLREVDPETPLLWVLRDHLGLQGTKYGCGKALCGACTVHVGGVATRACSMPIGQLVGKSITTIEGLGGEGGEHPVQRAWVDGRVAQCGYCQVGQIMTAAALLAQVPEPDDEAIDSAMAGNICRCGTYPRIRAAIKQAAALARADAAGKEGE